MCVQVKTKTKFSLRNEISHKRLVISVNTALHDVETCTIGFIIDVHCVSE